MMRLPKMDHRSPATLSEACSLIGAPGGKVKLLAGGTDLLVACKLRNLVPSAVVGLGGIPELKGIRFDKKEGLRIGAMTSLDVLRNDPQVLQHYPALAEAAAAVGTRQLQHMGTLGGNLCLETRCIYYNQSDSWRKARAVCFKMGGDICHVIPKGKKCYAVFSGDTAPALMALGARIKLASRAGERTLALGELYSGDGRSPLAIRPDEILQEALIPPPAARQGSAYLKYRTRESIDFPQAGVAVRLVLTEKGLCQDCAIAITAASSAPSLVPEAADLLKGKPLDDGLISEAARKAADAAHPVPNTCGVTPAYRKKITGILARRALAALVQKLA